MCSIEAMEGSNWRQKTLECLENNNLTSPNLGEESYLTGICNLLRKKTLQELSTEDLRILIGQQIGLPYLIPLAIETLENDLFAEGDYFEGDLLKNVLNIDTKFWDDHKIYWEVLSNIIMDKRNEIAQLKFDIYKFDNCKHKK